MSYYGVSPVRFASPSMVTTTLGVNDGTIGDQVEENGLRYTLVYNDGGASIPVGYGCVISSGTTGGYSISVTSNTSADYLIGVCRNATITTGAYAWVVSRGVTPVQTLASSGTVATKGLLELGANGLFAPYSNRTGAGPVVGQALTTIVTGASGNAFISVFT